MPRIFKKAYIMNHSKLAILVTLSAGVCGVASTQAQTVPALVQREATKEVIELWPNGLPAGATKVSQEKVQQLLEQQARHERGHVFYVDKPTMTVYPAPADKANGCAVIVCPGGGYNVLAWRHEGLELAEYFNDIGVTAFVLKYRVPRRIPDKIHWEPMQDVQRAIRLVRHVAQNANPHRLDSKRIGVLGFSAGGHLTTMAGVQYQTKCYEPQDKADQVSARPDFICPIYAAYLADGYEDNKAELGALVTVDRNTPPTFMAVTWDDTFRGAQAGLLFARLREHGVPAELHAYAKGGHGYGIRPSNNPVSRWSDHLTAWLKSSGFLDKPSAARKTAPTSGSTP